MRRVLRSAFRHLCAAHAHVERYCAAMRYAISIASSVCSGAIAVITDNPAADAPAMASINSGGSSGSMEVSANVVAVPSRYSAVAVESMIIPEPRASATSGAVIAASTHTIGPLLQVWNDAVLSVLSIVPSPVPCS